MAAIIEELQRRGFAGDQYEIDILTRGSALRIYGDRMLKMRNGRLEETASDPACELWPGWNG